MSNKRGMLPWILAKTLFMLQFDFHKQTKEIIQIHWPKMEQYTLNL